MESPANPGRFTLGLAITVAIFIVRARNAFTDPNDGRFNRLKRLIGGRKAMHDNLTHQHELCETIPYFSILAGILLEILLCSIDARKIAKARDDQCSQSD